MQSGISLYSVYGSLCKRALAIWLKPWKAPTGDEVLSLQLPHFKAADYKSLSARIFQLLLRCAPSHRVLWIAQPYFLFQLVGCSFDSSSCRPGLGSPACHSWRGPWSRHYKLWQPEITFTRHGFRDALILGFILLLESGHKNTNCHCGIDAMSKTKRRGGAMLVLPKYSWDDKFLLPAIDCVSYLYHYWLLSSAEKAMVSRR